MKTKNLEKLIERVNESSAKLRTEVKETDSEALKTAKERRNKLADELDGMSKALFAKIEALNEK